MQISDATRMIRGAGIDPGMPEVWADLGCGGGVFTLALAGILPAGSTINAIDNRRQIIIPGNDRVRIEFKLADFIKDELHLPGLKGVLMANSLHYVADKKNFLDSLIMQFHELESFLIVEYDSLQSNPWVPFPIDIPGLTELFTGAGFKKIKKLGERKSLFRQGNIYACFIRR